MLNEGQVALVHEIVALRLDVYNENEAMYFCLSKFIFIYSSKINKKLLNNI